MQQSSLIESFRQVVADNDDDSLRSSQISEVSEITQISQITDECGTVESRALSNKSCWASKHFVLAQDETYVKCCLCGVTLKYGGTTSHLTQHIHYKHRV